MNLFLFYLILYYQRFPGKLKQEFCFLLKLGNDNIYHNIINCKTLFGWKNEDNEKPNNNFYFIKNVNVDTNLNVFI